MNLTSMGIGVSLTTDKAAGSVELINRLHLETVEPYLQSTYKQGRPKGRASREAVRTPT